MKVALNRGFMVYWRAHGIERTTSICMYWFCRLLFGSGGVAQWSLQGPFYNKEAAQLVRRVPVPRFSLAIPLVALIAFYYLVRLFFSLLDCMF